MGAKAAITGEAQIGADTAGAVAPVYTMHGTVATAPPMYTESDPPRQRNGNRKQETERGGQDDDAPTKKKAKVGKRDSAGYFTHNRSNKELCNSFQRGQCQGSGNCPRNPQRVHQCCKCLSPDHGADQCPKGRGWKAPNPTN